MKLLLSWRARVVLERGERAPYAGGRPPTARYSATMNQLTLAVAFRKVRAHKELRVLLVLSLILGTTYSFVVPFMSIFGTEEVGMTPTVFGVFMTVTSLGAIVCSTALARLSDTRWARRSVLLIGSAAGTLGYVGYALVRDPFLLTVIGAAILGIAGGTYSQVFAYARELLKRDPNLEKDAALYMNIVRVSFAVAWTAGPAIAAFVMTSWSFVGTFFVASSLYLVFGFLVFIWVPHNRPAARAVDAAEAAPLSQILRNPAVFSYFLAFCLYFLCSTLGMMNLPLLIKRTLGESDTVVGIAYSVAPVFEIPLMISVGVLALRYPVHQIIRLTLLLAVAYYAALSVALQPLQIYLIQIMSALIVSVMGGLAITFFQDFLPDQPGTATNLYVNASRVGSVAGYLSFGPLTEWLGHRGIFVFAAVACLFIFALLTVAQRLRRSERPAPAG